MAYVLLLIGLMLTIAGVRNKQDDLFTLVKGDFSGSNSFIYWIAAIAIIGGIGYIPAFKGVSNAFLVLVLIVLIIGAENKNQLFEKLTQGLQQSTLSTGSGQTTGTDTNG